MSEQLRKAALDLYKPPFQFKYGYIFDANGETFSDTPDELIRASILRIRGWGRIQYLEEFKPEDLQDKVGELCAEALTEYWMKNS